MTVQINADKVLQLNETEGERKPHFLCFQGKHITRSESNEVCLLNRQGDIPSNIEVNHPTIANY